MSSIRDKRYGRAEFERYSEQMGYHDFEADTDLGHGYRNPNTNARWNFWVASRDAADLSAQPQEAIDRNRVPVTGTLQDSAERKWPSQPQSSIIQAQPPSAQGESASWREAVSTIRGIMEFIRLHAKPGGFDPALAERRVNARLAQLEKALAQPEQRAEPQGLTAADIDEAIDGVEEPRYYGYENPNTFQDGVWAAAKAIRDALSARASAGKAS